MPKSVMTTTSFYDGTQNTDFDALLLGGTDSFDVILKVWRAMFCFVMLILPHL